MKKLLYILIPFSLLLISGIGEHIVPFANKDSEKWADSVLAQMTDDEIIGQLFMVAAYSGKGTAHEDEISKLIRDQKIGGLIFFQGGPMRQATLTNKYQKLSKTPLFIAMDAEWGLAMRLDSVESFPKQMTLGALQNDTLIYQMGKMVALQCKRMGVHINFAPVVDINSNPANPVIGIRSFGEDKELVARKGLAYMKGMQDLNILTTAKHFPGHGDTESDSHVSLPVVNQTKANIETTEMYPFKELINQGLTGMMVAHLHIPAYDNSPNKAASLSKTIVTDVLKKDLGFNGLIFTDALNMKGVSSYYKPGEVDVKALLAGNDVLLFAENVPLAIKKIQKAINDKEISRDEVVARAKKILMAKYWCGLNKPQEIILDNLYQDLNNSYQKAFIQTLYNKSATVVKNDGDLFPIKFADLKKVTAISIGSSEGSVEWYKQLEKYKNIEYTALSKTISDSTITQLTNQCANSDVVIIGIHQVNSYAIKTYGISESSKKLITALITLNKKVILCLFGTPYAIKYFSGADAIICLYEDNAFTGRTAGQIIFGGMPYNGKLPVSVSTTKNNIGLESIYIQKMQYGFPEQVRMDSKTLQKIDTIALRAIKEGTMPGCQVVVIKDGMMIYQKNFGYHTYDKKIPVTDESLYDIASISKVAGTLQAAMFLYDRGLLDVNKKASYYLPELIGTNKEDLYLDDILTHQAGLQAFLPHWKRTVDTTFMPTFYRTVRSDSFPNMVTPNLFSCVGMEDSLWKWTVESPLLARPKKGKKLLPYHYVYSDLAFYILKRIVEKQLDMPMEDFLKDNIYDPLCLDDLMYTPLDQGIDIQRITPTELDKYFRKCLVQGTVHDPGAAMIGGVGGHAGLFANAHDLSLLMYMNLLQGYYGDYRFITPPTLKKFITPPFSTNRRGLGWDKPEPKSGGPCSYLASDNTFGHTGFTGTCAWVDPDLQLVYVFLSNRVNPDASNNRLIRDGIRTQIQTVIYRSILNFKEQ